MQRYSMGVGIVLGIALLMGAQRFASYDLLKVDDLEAKKIKIVDDKGVTRIGMGLIDDLAVISLYDSSGNAGVLITCSDGLAAVTLMDGENQAATLSRDKSPALRMFDKEGRGRIVTGVMNGTDPAIILADDKGKPTQVIQ